MTDSTASDSGGNSRLGDALADAAAISRFHILLIGAVAAVMFGWMMTGRYLWIAGAFSGLDWFLINLMNRVTDIEEDLKNGIRGTERVARRRGLVTIGSFVLMFGSIAASHLVWPALTPWRLLVQVIGLGYNYKIVPTLRGLSRFKEIYFWKNFGSALLFVLTGFMYPLAVAGTRHMSWPAIVCLILFFIPFELTYEVLYDLRDLEGDRAEGVPTYPVVHGVARSLQIINGLLIGSSLVLVGGVVSGALGLRELLFLVAPLAQFILYRRWSARGPGGQLTPRDCIVLTHVGTAQLIFFMLGTALWIHAGLPADVFLR